MCATPISLASLSDGGSCGARGARLFAVTRPAIGEKRISFRGQKYPQSVAPGSQPNGTFSMFNAETTISKPRDHSVNDRRNATDNTRNCQKHVEDDEPANRMPENIVIHRSIHANGTAKKDKNGRRE